MGCRSLTVVWVAFPIRDRFAVFLSFPPRLVVFGNRHVGEDRIPVQHRQGIRVGLSAGTGRHAEESGFGIDGPPAGKTRRGDEHGEVGFSASRGESRGDVVHLPLGIFDADDQHMFGQPAFRAGLVAGNA